jgi:hypothetical protein
MHRQGRAKLGLEISNFNLLQRRTNWKKAKQAGNSACIVL